MKEEIDKPVIYWLASGCLLILTMVVVGGITRLTHSGLSMVQWSLFMGSIPPLNQTDWEQVFGLYKQTPEFRLINYNFTLEEFKSIFLWEYVHRMIGRLIGLVFIIPFAYFLISKRLDRAFVKKLLIVFALGAFQGFMGWYMVKSGLVKDPNVSHYRLAAHLIIAFVLYSYIFWLILEKAYRINTRNVSTVKLQNVTIWLLAAVLIQITYGAFVSGLKAGAIYNTFPMMGEEWVAESVAFAFQKDGLISLLENHASVQFIHRTVAYVVVLLGVLLWWRSRNTLLTKIQQKAIFLLLTATSIQVMLGIFTLIYAVPITLGVLHQLGALILLTCVVNLYFQLKYGDTR